MLREPPHSLEAEQAVLGCCLLNPGAVDCVDGLRPDDFYRADHREVFEAILDANEDGEPIDSVTISQRLEGRGAFREDGGFGYLVELTQAAPSIVNVRAYARLVRDGARRRELIAAAMEIAEQAYGAGSVAEKVDFAQGRLMALSGVDAGSAVRVADLRETYLQAMKQRAAGELVGTPTMFADLDRVLGGLRPGNLVVVAGRPSMGKSSIAFQMAHRNARNGRPVLALSMEMSRIEVLDRLMAWESGMALGSITSGRPNSPDYLHSALEHAGGWPLLIDDTPALTVHQVRARCRAAAKRGGLDLVVLDYLQLMAGDGETRNTQIEGITRGLKSIAKELAVPVVALSQLSRKCEERTDRRPMLSDLRESGAIEQDADVVMMIHREEVYRREPGEWRGKAEVLIRKNRQGPAADVRLAWHGVRAAFDDFEGDWPEPERVRTTRAPIGFDA